MLVEMILDQFRKIIIRYKRTGYNMNVVRQTAHRGSTLGLLLLQHNSVCLGVEYLSCVISVLNLDLMHE